MRIRVPQEGSILLMTLVILGMLVVVLASSILLISRQFGATVNQEQRERAFHASEAGIHYVLFLLNEAQYTTQALLGEGGLEEQDVLNEQSGTEIGSYKITFDSIEGVQPGRAIHVTSDGVDASTGRQCQRIAARIDRVSLRTAAYAITSWDHLPSCG